MIIGGELVDRVRLCRRDVVGFGSSGGCTLRLLGRRRSEVEGRVRFPASLTARGSFSSFFCCCWRHGDIVAVGGAGAAGA